VQSYKSALDIINQVDADVVTFESCSAHGIDLEAFGKTSPARRSHRRHRPHSLQVERPEEIADHIRHALKHIPAERLVISSDCGMGREGMSRRHAYYKTVSLVSAQYRAQGAWLAASRGAGRRSALLAGAAGEVGARKDRACVKAIVTWRKDRKLY